MKAMVGRLFVAAVAFLALAADAHSGRIFSRGLESLRR